MSDNQLRFAIGEMVLVKSEPHLQPARIIEAYERWFPPYTVDIIGSDQRLNCYEDELLPYDAVTLLADIVNP